MRLVAAGLDFHSAPLAVRERVVISDDEAPDLLRYLVGNPGIAGAAVLSTCNRTEFYVTCESEHLAGQVVVKLGQYLDPGNTHLAECLVADRDEAAVAHICRVAAGLESMVLGEAQVLGQLRRAHRQAADAGTLDAKLDRVLRGAIEAGKRVRTETAVGRGTSSLSEVALAAAAAVVGDLSGVGVLLIGAGKMSRLAARRLVELGAQVKVASRSESAHRLAAEMGIVPLESSAISDAIAAVDVVISSTSCPGHVLGAREVAVWQAKRRGRSLCIVDLAVPRDVEPAAAAVSGVHLIDVDELGQRVAQCVDDRCRALPAATAIVSEATAAIAKRIGHHVGASPTIAALVEQADTLRCREMERTLSHLDVNDEVVARIEQLTRSLVRKLLHAPIGHLRAHANDPAAAQMVRQVFALDGTCAAHEPHGTTV